MALLILADRIFLQIRGGLMEFAASNKLPSVNAYRELVEAGGLMSYGPSYEDMHRRAAEYVDKILALSRRNCRSNRPSKFTLTVNSRPPRC